MATRFENYELEVKAGPNQNGRALQVKDLDDVTFHLFADLGVFSGTYRLQGSVDGGAHYFNLGGVDMAAELGGSIPETLTHIRLRTVNANADPVNNVIKCVIAGRGQRVEG